MIVGFAAESGNLEEYAKEKLLAKGADLIVANPIGRPDAGFGSETNQVTVITRQGTDSWPLLSKEEVARRLWKKIASLLEEAESL